MVASEPAADAVAQPALQRAGPQPAEATDVRGGPSRLRQACTAVHLCGSMTISWNSAPKSEGSLAQA